MGTAPHNDLPSDQLRALKAQMLLDQAEALGVDLEELIYQRDHGELPGLITLHDFLPEVRSGAPTGSAHAYGGYWDVLDEGIPGMCACMCPTCLAAFDRRDADKNRLGCPCQVSGECGCAKSDFDRPEINSCTATYAGIGTKALSAISAGDIDVARQWVKTRAQKRWANRNAKRGAAGRPGYKYSGKSAEELLRAAASVIFRTAMADPKTRITTNLALLTAKPKRPKTTARSYGEAQLAELWDALFTSGGDDPELDMLIFWFHLETGARRGGALGLLLGDLDLTGQNAQLREKGDVVAWQPMSAELQRSLIGHALERGDVIARVDPGLDPAAVTVDDVVAGRAVLRPDRPVFYYRRPKKKTLDDGTVIDIPHPLTRRRYNTLWDRICRHLPWADQLHSRSHDLRKCGAEFIERACGYSVAKAWLRHTTGDVTMTYTTARPEEVAEAFELLSGRTHPLAEEARRAGRLGG